MMRKKSKIEFFQNTLTGIFNMKFLRGAIDLEIDDTNAPLLELKFLKPIERTFVIDFSSPIAKRQWFGLFFQTLVNAGAGVDDKDRDLIVKNDFAKLFNYYVDEFRSNGIKLPKYDSVEDTPKSKSGKKDKAKRFYIFYEGSFIEKLNAQPIEIKGFEDFDFFVHRTFDPDPEKSPVHDGNYWVVTEAKSGSILAQKQPTKKEAIQATIDVLNSKGKNVFKAALQAAIDKNGISPRYKVENVAKAKALALEIELELLAA